ncbi:MAG: recombinase family protein [Lachnotalea sp.]
MQVCMLEEYVHKSEDMLLYKVYSDNGFTGTNFERPAFSKLIEDMKLGKFNTIVVKDGSRLGRNYLEAGAYMESVFPTYGIRFISVNDHYDSADLTCQKDGISVPLKNIMNEQYSKDLSRKLTSAFRVKQMSGAFIGGLTTYGYRKNENDRNKLVVDKETAPIIRRIFQGKADGMSDGAIANELNEEGILSPFAYRYAKGLVRAEKYREMPWKRGTISQMLTNKMYIGHMVQGRHRQSLSMHEKKHTTPENEWIIVENTHEAIIDKEIFELVQKIIKNKKEKYSGQTLTSVGETENLFRKKIFCADCGRAMEIGKSTSKVAVHRYYRCKLYNETAGKCCSLKSIKKKEIEKVVFDTIWYHMKLFSGAEKMIKEMNTTPKAKKKKEEYLQKIAILQQERLKYVKLAGGLYEDYEQKLLNVEEYTFISEEYDSKIKSYDMQIDDLRKFADSYKKDFTGNKDLGKKIKKFSKCMTLNREMVEAFISRIDVTDATHIKITFDCMDEFAAMIRINEQRRLEVDAYNK